MWQLCNCNAKAFKINMDKMVDACEHEWITLPEAALLKPGFQPAEGTGFVSVMR